MIDSVAPTTGVVGVAVYGELAVEGSIDSTIVDFVVDMECVLLAMYDDTITSLGTCLRRGLLSFNTCYRAPG